MDLIITLNHIYNTIAKNTEQSIVLLLFNIGLNRACHMIRQMALVNGRVYSVYIDSVATLPLPPPVSLRFT